jgi:hypothetical protein
MKVKVTGKDFLFQIMMREGSRGTDPLIPKHNYTNK